MYNIFKLIYFLILLSTASLLVGCSSKNSSYKSQGNDLSYDFNAQRYEQSYFIDPDARLFRSSQNITIINVSEKATNKINFSLHPYLIIDQIEIINSGGQEILSNEWKLVGIKKVKRIWADSEINEFPVYQVSSKYNFEPGQRLNVKIDYHLKDSFFQNLPKKMYELTASPTVFYAIGPFTGVNPFFGRNIAAPFKISIKHPADFYSCAPGNLINSVHEVPFATDVYESRYPNIPTFSCGKYKKITKKSDIFQLEYYLYPEQTIKEEMIDSTFKILDLYSKYFGDNGTREYRFGTVGKINTMNSGGESKGNVIFFTDFATRLNSSWFANLIARIYQGGLSGKESQFLFLSHEIYHNWNLFYTIWSGSLYEWFGEGGANFASAWASEKILGNGSGARARKFFIKQYIKNKGYESTRPLETVRKTGRAEKTLMYYYGAMIWEQLRRRIGDKLFFEGLSEFYQRSGFKKTTYEDLLESLQAKTRIDVEKFLNQWITENAKIKLSIKKVNINKSEKGYYTTVELIVDAKKDYNFVTDIGYKTSTDGNLNIVPIEINKKGKNIHLIETEKKPIYIQIDPNYSVPRVNLSNCDWKG